jgi:DNA-directed RNA polymerase subunit RPC12/RpoP
MLAKCPNCGVEFEPEGEGIFFICKYCNASIFILPQYGGLRYLLKPVADIKDVEGIIKDFFIKNEYTGELKLRDKEAVLFPFYKTVDSNRLIPAAISKYNPIISHLIYKGGDLVFFKSEENTGYRVINPEVEPEGVGKNRVNIIYYPLIFVDYEYSGEEYSLIVDAFSREVITEILPIKRDTFREKVYMFLFIITSFVLFIEFYAFESVAIGLFLNTVTLIILWLTFPSILKLIEDINVSEDEDH